MAKPKLKEKVIKLRKQGKSYSQIREEVDVAKSTLSRWLQNYPLSKQRIKELQADNPRRIEKFRETMRKKREAEFADYEEKAKKDLEKMDSQNLLIAGFFLYWAEGGKTARYKVSVSNTDPAMLVFFKKWLKSLGASEEKFRATLHLYADMNILDQTEFWSSKLGLKKVQFTKPYIKDSNLGDLSYANGFGYGTCNLYYNDKEIAYYVRGGIQCLQEYYKN